MRRILWVLPALCCVTSMSLVGPPTSAASAASAAGGSCNANGRYVLSRSISGYSSAAAITHATQYTVAAHSKLTVKKTAEKQSSITAGLKIGGGLSGEAGWGIAKVGAHFDVAVNKSGTSTASKSVSVTTNVTNSSGRNRLYIAFSGVLRYRANVKITYCARVYASVGEIRTTTGALTTFGVPSGGFAYCKGGYQGAVTKLAIKRFCK